MDSIDPCVFYKSVMDTVVDPIIVINDKGVIVEANNACEKLLGYAKHELISQNVSLLMPKDIGDLHNDYIQAYLSSKQAKIIGIGREVIALHKSGETLHCQLSVSETKTASGTYFTGILRSMAEIDRAKKTISQLALVARYTDNSVIITDTEGKIEWVNKSFEKLTGHTLNEVTGVSSSELLQGELTDPDEVKKINDAISTLRPVSSTLINYKKSGTPYWADMTIQPAVNEADGSCHFVSIQKDITDTINRQEMLQKQIDFFRALNSWSRTSTGTPHLRSLLKAMTELSDFDECTLCLSPKIDLPKAFYSSKEKNARDEDPFAKEIINTKRPIVVNDHHPTCKPLTSGQHYIGVPMLAGHHCVGAIGGYYHHDNHTEMERVIDIFQLAANTFAWLLENRRTRNSLEIHLERLNRSQNYANIGTWDWNIKTGDLFWTSRIAPLFGHREGELETSYDNFLNAVHPEDRLLVQNAVVNCIEHGETYDIDHRVVWPDGSIHWVNEKGDVLRDEHGNAVQMLGVIQDIQKIKETESALKVAQAIAEKANKAKSEFLSSMSHELRTPLNSILGFSQLMLAEDISPDHQENLELIHKSGSHLLELVDDVLELAKIDAGLLKTNMGDVDLAVIIEQCLSLLSNQIEAKSITIEAQCAEFHPLVRGDELRLKQVILNLLSNAVKYNKQGGKITISCEQPTPTNFRMHIVDTGYGIDHEKQKNLFKPFSRLGYESSSIEGVGIGLVITKRLIEAMGGQIGVSSEQGVGSDFWFEVQLSQQQGLQTQKASGVNTDRKPQTVNSDLSKAIILSIEDNEINRLVIKKLCKSHLNTDVSEATTVEEGIAAVKRQKPDIVLLDIHLPDGKGTTVAQTIRELYGDQVKIIAVTADVVSASQFNQNRAFFDEIEYKPINAKSLISKIKMLQRLQ